MPAGLKHQKISILCLIVFVLVSCNTAFAGRNAAEDLWEQADKSAKEGRYKEAVRLYERSLALCSPSELDCTGANLSGLGAAYDALNQNEKALRYYEQSLQISRRMDNKSEIALDLLNIGAMLYKGLNQHTKALPYLEESLSLYRALGKKDETALLLSHIGGIRAIQGRYQEALKLLTEALQISRTLSDKTRTADILTGMGNISNQLGMYDQADKHLTEAIAMLRKMNDPALLSTSLNYKGLNDFDMHRIDKSLNEIDEAIAIAIRLDDKLKIATYTSNLGIVQMNIGQFDKARKHYSQTLKMAREISLPGLQATSLSNLGQIENALANYDLSIQYTKEALRINRSIDRPLEIAINLNNIGKSYYDMGLFDEALKWHNEALAIRKKLGNPSDIAASLTNIGAVYLFKGEPERAEKIFLERRQMQSQMRGIKLRNPGLAETWLQLGQYSKALDLLESEKPSANAGEPFLAEYEMMLGRALMGNGRLKEASRHLFNAYGIMEELRSATNERGSFLKGGGAGGRFRTYRALTAAVSERVLAGEQHDETFSAFGSTLANAAFTFSEATKSRALLEKIALTGNDRIAGTALSSDLADRQKKIQSKVENLEKGREKALRAGGQAYSDFRKEMQSAQRELDSLVDRIRIENPLYAAIKYPRPVPAQELPLAENELVLAYAVSDEASYLFVVRKGGVRKVIRINMRRGALEDRIKSLLEPLMTRRLDQFSTARAAELYKLLLADGLSYARPGDNITIIPDGILGTLPFEILASRDTGTPEKTVYAGDNYNFTYYQSASLMALKRNMPASKTSKQLFALGNPVFSNQTGTSGGFRGLAISPKQHGQLIEFPQLPETETEVKNIAAMFNTPLLPPDILLGQKATEAELKNSSLGNYRYIHFATHASLPGMIKEVNEPFILLGQNSNGTDNDGFLTLSEVLEMRLGAEMVMLSACLTGVGREVEGEGVSNFARAFQSAGAKRVVVSLWEVASEPAVEYVTTYYTALKAGLTPSKALQKARRHMRSKLPHPYYWGVFILHGES